MEDDTLVWAETNGNAEFQHKEFTIHNVGGNRVNSLICRLRIVSHPPESGFYLLYLDENGSDLTDTYHATVADALDQAKCEFEIDLDGWDFFQPLAP